jgi:hypothetical protein
MNDKTIDTKEITPSEKEKKCCGNWKHRKFTIATVIVGLFLLILVSFVAGVSVGFHKAKFSYRFGENYERNFMGQRSGMMGSGPIGMIKEKFGEFEGRGMRNGHGVAGTIISILDNSLVIKDKDNKENTVSVSDGTVINQGRDTIKIGDLKNDEEIVIIGKPGDDGVIAADLIRVFGGNVTN